MASQISIQPPVLDLLLYAGDGISFKLICTDDADPPQPVNVTGAIAAQIRVDRLSGDPAIVEFSSDLAAADVGEIVLSLTGDQTQDLIEHPSVVKGKFTGNWDVQWTADGAQPRTLCQGKVECLADVTR
jgi:hypothetical protein